MNLTGGLRIHTVVSDPFAENCFIVHLAGQNSCLVIDPGMDSGGILDLLRRHSLTPSAILNTHGHLDHIAGNDALKQAFPLARLVIGWGDAHKLESPEHNLSADYGMCVRSGPADQLTRHGDQLQFAEVSLEVRETPGHSAGHVIFVHHAGDATSVFGGDVLFAGSVGRTDLADGDMDQLLASIQAQLLTLPDSTVVFPGHGPPTRIGAGKRSNPFLRRGPGLG